MSNKRVKTLTHIGSEVPADEALPLLLARILTRVKITEAGCWEWQDNLNSIGYAQATFAGKRWMVHRFMYQACTGQPIPDGFDICHNCHNKACINPYHIRQDTHAAKDIDPPSPKLDPWCPIHGKDPDYERDKAMDRKAIEPRYHEVTRHSDGTQFVPTEDGYIQIDP